MLSKVYKKIVKIQRKFLLGEGEEMLRFHALDVWMFTNQSRDVALTYVIYT